MRLELSRAIYKEFRAYSQKWFPEVSKTLSNENSLETLTKDLEQVLKNRVQISQNQKGIYNSLEPFIKDFEQILKNGFQKSLILSLKNLEPLLKNGT